MSFRVFAMELALRMVITLCHLESGLELIEFSNATIRGL